jgi:hypothetical protein
MGIRILESTRHESKGDHGGVDVKFSGWASVSDIDSALVFIETNMQRSHMIIVKI